MHFSLRTQSAVLTLAVLAVPFQASAYSIKDFPSAQHVSRRQLQATPVRQTVVSPAASAPVSVSSTCTNVTWKKAKFFGAAVAQIPSTWSTYVQSEMTLATNFDDFWNHIFFSTAQDGVAFGDVNWSQIDMAKMSGANVKALEAWYKKTAEKGDVWSTQKIGNRTFDVLTFPLDNGQVTKGGTGGKVYFLSWTAQRKAVTGGGMETADLGLIVWKQAKGDTGFECGAQKFIETLDLDAIASFSSGGYPVVQ